MSRKNVTESLKMHECELFSKGTNVIKSEKEGNSKEDY